MLMTIASGWKRLWKEEEGLGTLEMILIIAILIAVAVIFRKQITDIISSLLEKADKKSSDFMDGK